jgi:hypothetical protein
MEKIKRGFLKGMVHFGAVIVSVPLVIIHFISGALIGILMEVGEKNSIPIGNGKYLKPDDVDLSTKDTI